jgi:hypothetical protein
MSVPESQDPTPNQSGQPFSRSWSRREERIGEGEGRMTAAGSAGTAHAGWQMAPDAED